MGFASSPETRDTLAGYGVRVSGYRWRWAPGLKGGTFPEHAAINAQVRTYQEDFEYQPGEPGVLPCTKDGDSTCMCSLVPAYRTADGRLAKPGMFQPPVTIAERPVTAALSEPFDWTPLTEALAAFANPQPVTVTIPDGAIVINLPEQAAPVVHVAAPEVNVAAPNVEVAAPSVNVEAPNVTVESPTVNVEAPIVTVEPTIELPKPAQPRMLPPAKPRETRIIRDIAGVIIGMEEVT